MRYLLIGLALFAPMAAYSQRSALSTTEQMIRKLDQAAARAILEKDEKAIERLFTKDAATNNPRSGLTFGSQGVIDLMRQGTINYHSFDRNIESVQVRGKTAIVMGNEVVVMKNSDGPGETIKRRYTNIWMKTGKQWQIVARHANIICK